jgi:small subunit ribosomal protein S8
MSLSDPIADMLTRIRNAQQARKPVVSIKASAVALNIAKVLEDEGYIAGFRIVNENQIALKSIDVTLKYVDREPVIVKITRVSRPGLRIYKQKQSLPTVMSGLGIAIISTSKGILSDAKARELGVGGEVLCLVA